MPRLEVFADIEAGGAGGPAALLPPGEALLDRRAHAPQRGLLLLYLTRLGTDATVLPGGYRVEGPASTGRGVSVEKLAPESPYERLVLPGDGRGVA
jgi:hypothetical protein